MSKPSIVTDHALIRWLERGYGIDLDPYRKSLEEAAAPFVEAGAASAPVTHGWISIAGGKVVTFTYDRPRHETCWDNKAFVNRTDAVREEPHWRMRARKRAHR